MCKVPDIPEVNIVQYQAIDMNHSNVLRVIVKKMVRNKYVLWKLLIHINYRLHSISLMGLTALPPPILSPTLIPSRVLSVV